MGNCSFACRLRFDWWVEYIKKSKYKFDCYREGEREATEGRGEDLADA